MPGETIEDVKKHIEKYMGGDDVEIEFIKGKEPSLVSPTETRAFETISRLAVAIDEKTLWHPISLWEEQTHITTKMCAKTFIVFHLLLSTLHCFSQPIPQMKESQSHSSNKA